jgi:flagellar protein FliO/FliZ
MPMPWFVSILFTVYSGFVWAEDKLEVGSAVSRPADYAGQIAVSLLLVLIIIFLAAWLLRRFGHFPAVAEGNLRVLGSLSVGQRERILLLQVGQEQLLVGVTTSRITTLHTLSEPVSLSETQPRLVKGSFAKRLQEAIAQRRERESD